MRYLWAKYNNILVLFILLNYIYFDLKISVNVCKMLQVPLYIGIQSKCTLSELPLCSCPSGLMRENFDWQNIMHIKTIIKAHV